MTDYKPFAVICRRFPGFRGIANVIAEVAALDGSEKLAQLVFVTFTNQLHAPVIQVSNVPRYFESFRNLQCRIPKSHALHSSRIKHFNALSHNEPLPHRKARNLSNGFADCNRFLTRGKSKDAPPNIRNRGGVIGSPSAIDSINLRRG